MTSPSLLDVQNQATVGMQEVDPEPRQVMLLIFQGCPEPPGLGEEESGKHIKPSSFTPSVSSGLRKGRRAGIDLQVR